jgi:hypothetical protein
MKPYVVKQGDYLTKLSHRMGFSAKDVWSHPKNAELKKLRGDGEILCAGDILHVPDEPKKRLPLEAETSNRYEARVPRLPVRLVLAIDGEPLAGERYRVEGIGDDEEKVTDGEGAATFEVDVHIRAVTVVLLDRKMRCRMMVGDLDPVSEPSGARMRLTNLGFYDPAVAGEDQYEAHQDGALRAALVAFQRAKGLEVTGELDETTRAELVAQNGA